MELLRSNRGYGDLSTRVTDRGNWDGIVRFDGRFGSGNGERNGKLDRVCRAQWCLVSQKRRLHLQMHLAKNYVLRKGALHLSPAPFVRSITV